MLNTLTHVCICPGELTGELTADWSSALCRKGKLNSCLLAEADLTTQPRMVQTDSLQTLL